ncbi:leucyl/phenylalanyl-tRNA--protein transferase [Bacteriovorax sp. Seq25_V]|uniref:leucyl/phenylalanyl-tRNA--protein transferase n=1 Tax=Bacteriovorax sp. Seq25_V TaxID=1201288 RepID=UPI00038A47CF|nr:leucyl/phenylalanyl-tRNA--protein transferase [Bacteriovorax sp. Seq25_V]EQC46025.1 leucyltransferase [Bacteriovorax sp. Seq25_V]
MPIIDFPNIDTADENGLLALGGDLHPDSLLLAYGRGIYPWPIGRDFPMAWFSPSKRGVIFTEDLHVSRSLLKFIKKCDFSVTFNTDFKEVISTCAKVHNQSREGTWITKEIIDGYTEFHHHEHAYSIEVRNPKGELIGGLYGVILGGFISGESMFHKEKNASKVALFVLLYNLRKLGIPYLDTQMITNTTKNFGATEISRDKFKHLLQMSLGMKKIDVKNFNLNIHEIAQSLTN